MLIYFRHDLRHYFFNNDFFSSYQTRSCLCAFTATGHHSGKRVPSALLWPELFLMWEDFCETFLVILPALGSGCDCWPAVPLLNGLTLVYSEAFDFTNENIGARQVATSLRLQIQLLLSWSLKPRL